MPKNACPRCGGNLLKDHGDLTCLQCGHSPVALEPLPWSPSQVRVYDKEKLNDKRVRREE